jgi:hypothetical protein
MTSGKNLTGIWQGLYSYPRNFASVGFVATLIETASAVTGSSHEPHRTTGAVLCATLFGRRAGALIDFVKSYEQTEGGYGADVRYVGTVAEDGTEIEGQWSIGTAWSGRFLMVRGAREATAKKKFARVWTV